MTIARAPQDPAAQLQWLVDRAEISELLIEFARALDERDWAAYADTYTEDGLLDIAPHIRHAGREGKAEFVAASLSGYPGGTHHLSTNHAIRIDGDSATTRSYLLAAHVLDTPDRHADGAGWYDCELRRTPAGWRFATVRLTVRYTSGEPITH